MNNPYQKELNKYAQVEVESKVANASPEELIHMLLQGAIQRMRTAKAAIASQNTQTKCESISKAMHIITELRISLDHEQGGEVATNLDSVYEHIQVLLMQANLKNGQESLEKAENLLSEIFEAWTTIMKEKQGETAN